MMLTMACSAKSSLPFTCSRHSLACTSPSSFTRNIAFHLHHPQLTGLKLDAGFVCRGICCSYTSRRSNFRAASFFRQDNGFNSNSRGFKSGSKASAKPEEGAGGASFGWSGLGTEKKIDVGSDLVRFMKGGCSVWAVSWVKLSVLGKVWGVVDFGLECISQLFLFLVLLDVVSTVATWIASALTTSISVGQCPSCGSSFRFDKEQAGGVILSCPTCFTPIRYDGRQFVKDGSAPYQNPFSAGFGNTEEVERRSWKVKKSDTIVDVEATVRDKE